VTDAITKADRQRYELMRGLNCVACAQVGAFHECDVSHETNGGRRTGNENTMLECPWHHRGVPPWGCTQQGAHKRLGPSRARNPRAYHAKFGSDEQLLELTNKALQARRDRTVGSAA
jgi:hypothetical protein